jgi:coenzyme PQQ synthesis protein D (PqqD)
VLPKPHPKVVSQSVADGGVLLDTGGEIYFGLNAVGMRVWQLLPPASATIDELCAVLGREYPDAPREQLQADVAELLDQLAREGLVVSGPGAA